VWLRRTVGVATTAGGGATDQDEHADDRDGEPHILCLTVLLVTASPDWPCSSAARSPVLVPRQQPEPL